MSHTREDYERVWKAFDPEGYERATKKREEFFERLLEYAPKETELSRTIANAMHKAQFTTTPTRLFYRMAGLARGAIGLLHLANSDEADGLEQELEKLENEWAKFHNIDLDEEV